MTPSLVSLIDFTDPPPVGTRYRRPGKGYVASAVLVNHVKAEPDVEGSKPWLVWAATCSHCKVKFRTWSSFSQAQPLPAHCQKCRSEALRRAGRPRSSAP